MGDHIDTAFCEDEYDRTGRRISAPGTAEAFDSVRALKLKFRPKLRPRFDSRSYLYNTDGLLFSDMGYPVILFNEHVNRLENLTRVGYHHTTDWTLW